MLIMGLRNVDFSKNNNNNNYYYETFMINYEKYFMKINNLISEKC